MFLSFLRIDAILMLRANWGCVVLLSTSLAGFTGSLARGPSLLAGWKGWSSKSSHLFTAGYLTVRCRSIISFWRSIARPLLPSDAQSLDRYLQGDLQAFLGFLSRGRVFHPPTSKVYSSLWLVSTLVAITTFLSVGHSLSFSSNLFILLDCSTSSGVFLFIFAPRLGVCFCFSLSMIWLR